MMLDAVERQFTYLSFVFSFAENFVFKLLSIYWTGWASRGNVPFRIQFLDNGNQNLCIF